MTATQRIWLTPHAYDGLKEELAVLLGHDPAGAVDQEQTLSADTYEEVTRDAGYRSARIQKIQELLHNAVVGEAPPDDGIAEPGMVLTVHFDDQEDTEMFLLGARDRADSSGLEVYSPDSPLGAALAGARPGEQRTYTVPNGDVINVTLKRAIPYGQHKDHNAGA